MKIGCSEMDWKKVYKKIQMINWLTLLTLSSLSFLIMSARFTTGVILGGIVIIANFNVLQHTICGAFSAGGAIRSSNKMVIIVKYYLRLLALGVIVYLLIANGGVEPVGLAVGLSTVVFGIMVLGIHMALKEKRGEAI